MIHLGAFKVDQNYFSFWKYVQS